MRYRLAIGIAIGLMSAAQTPQALAQTAPAAAATATAANPRAEALVRRYLKSIHFEDLMDTTMGAMLPLMTDEMSRQYPSITPEQRQMVAGVVRETMQDSFTPKMIDRMTSIYAQTFTESELEAIVAFYESPVGQAVIRKTPLLAPKSADVARALVPEVQKEVAARLCAKIDCLQATHPLQRPKVS